MTKQVLKKDESILNERQKEEIAFAVALAIAQRKDKNLIKKKPGKQAVESNLHKGKEQEEKSDTGSDQKKNSIIERESFHDKPSPDDSGKKHTQMTQVHYHDPFTESFLARCTFGKLDPLSEDFRQGMTTMKENMTSAIDEWMKSRDVTSIQSAGVAQGVVDTVVFELCSLMRNADKTSKGIIRTAQEGERIINLDPCESLKCLLVLFHLCFEIRRDRPLLLTTKDIRCLPLHMSSLAFYTCRSIAEHVVSQEHIPEVQWLQDGFVVILSNLHTHTSRCHSKQLELVDIVVDTLASLQQYSKLSCRIWEEVEKWQSSMKH